MSDIVYELRSLASSDDGMSPYCCDSEVCEAAAAEIERLRAALLSCPCPRPANSVPEHSEWTVMDCRNRKECGCVYGQALDGDGQLTRGGVE